MTDLYTFECEARLADVADLKAKYPAPCLACNAQGHGEQDRETGDVADCPDCVGNGHCPHCAADLTWDDAADAYDCEVCGFTTRWEA